MNIRRISGILGIFLSGAVLAPTAYASCGASFCTLNTSWESQGVSHQTGTSIDLRYEYIDQDQPRTGSEKISVGAIRKHHDEVRTLNRNLIATIDYAPDTDNGVSVQLPYIRRDHEHIHNHHGAKLHEAWQFDGIGDIRVLGRRRLSGDGDVAYGMLLGMKLPTGSTTDENGDGDRAERSLQPGTGTTDLLAGVYASAMRMLGDVPARFFAQGLIQGALDKSSDYRPGNKYSVDVGVAYPADGAWSGMLQLNGLIRDRDTGAEAETNDTGGSYLWLSPGVSYAMDDKTQLYFFAQLPLYQHVNGVQLTADWTLAAGIHRRF